MDREETERVLSADHYPALKVLKQTEAAPPPLAPAPVQVPSAVRLERMLRNGSFRSLDREGMARVLREMLEGDGRRSLPVALGQLRTALVSRAPADQRWAMTGVGALVALRDRAQGLLPQLRDALGQALCRAEQPLAMEEGLDLLAQLLGHEAAEGHLGGVRDYLVRLERGAGEHGTRCAQRLRASRAIIRPVLELGLGDDPTMLEVRVLPFFRFLGEPAAWTLTGFLAEEENRRRRARIVELLKGLGALSVPALKAGLKGPWHLVRNALNLLGDLGEPEAFEYVVPCLEHRDRRVLRAAVRALLLTGRGKAERYLLEALPAANPERQLELLPALGQLRSAKAVPLLGPLVAAGPEPNRIEAIRTLGRIGHASGVPILEAVHARKGRIFRSAEPLPVRLASAEVLAGLALPEARSALERVLGKEPKGPGRDALLWATGAAARTG